MAGQSVEFDAVGGVTHFGVAHRDARNLVGLAQPDLQLVRTGRQAAGQVRQIVAASCGRARGRCCATPTTPGSTTRMPASSVFSE